jgi:hypothetical protein
MTTIITPALGKNEKYLLDEYLGTQNQRKGLYDLIQNLGEVVPRLYRGTMYFLDDVKVGHIYRHWNLVSSWSTEEQVATQFALGEYVPEELIDQMVRNKRFSLKDSNHLFVPIVLYCENVKGFVVNHHYKNHLYANENEVIVYDTKIKITSIEKAFYRDKTYYRVSCQSLI